MFVRDKRIGRYTYIYLVENVREDGRTKQRIIANLGRKEMVLAHGDLDRLARSVARLAQRSMCCRWTRARPRPMRCAGGSARRCCSNGCGTRPAADRY